MLSAKSVQRNTLHEQTYQALRESILSGELAPGDRLIEAQLAEQLQVSRTPIREAIRQLQREELVTADDVGWLRVATVSASEARHLYDCRIALETLAVTEACSKATALHLQQLQDLISQAERLAEQDPSSSDRAMQPLEIDYLFHRTLAQSSGNTYLVSLLDQVFGKMALLRVHTTYHNPDVLEIRTEHKLIYEAIAHRNCEAAVQAIQSHLIASKTRVVQELDHFSPSTHS